MWETGRVPSTASSSNPSVNAGMNALYASTGMAWSSSALVIGDPSTMALRNAFVPPTWSMCAWVSTTRLTVWPRSFTAAANGCHWERTIIVSTIVSPSSSPITPALDTPDSPPGWSQTHTRSAISCRVSVGAAVTTATVPTGTGTVLRHADASARTVEELVEFLAATRRRLRLTRPGR